MVFDIIYTSKLADGRQVCQRGYLNAIDVKSGKLKWQAVPAQSDSATENCPSVGFNPDLRFKYGLTYDRVLKNQLASVPVIQMPRTDQIPNQFPGKGRLHSPVASTSDLISMPAYSGVVYMLNASSGAYINSLYCDRGALYQGVAVTKDVVSFGCGYRIFGGPNDAGNNIMIYSIKK